MKRLRVAVIGARGIGKFHVREFKAAGAEIIAIVGTSVESLAQTAEDLRSYGVIPLVYTSLETLIASQSVDAVSVCTPPEYHYDQAKQCLLAGLHTFCEKPFICTSDFDNTRFAQELITIATEKNLVISMNTQWPSVLPFCKPFVNMSKVSEFSMSMQPLAIGKEMLVEQVSHMNSMLIHLMPEGEASDIRFTQEGEEKRDVYFTYENNISKCQVHYAFKHKKERPRAILFSINGTTFEREIGDNHKQTLVTGESTITIPDPFAASISTFVHAVEKRDEALVTPRQIIENMRLQDQIMRSYTLSY